MNLYNNNYNWITSQLLLTLISINLPQMYSVCNIYIQSNNIRYIDTLQQQLYNISDPCTTTCTDGYYGDFCQDLSEYSTLPMGPWNQAGYCTNGGGVMRSMTIDVSNIFSVQYTKKDSVLIGLSYGGYSNSVLSEISLYSRKITPVLYPTPAGSLDALIVRKGCVYVARSIKVNGALKYDIATTNAPLQAQTLMYITVKAMLIEVCADKGKITSFSYGSNKIIACYPSGVCNTWIPSTPVISGMISGADCGNTLYASSGANILKITSNGYSTLKSTPTIIYCLTGIPDINVLLYKSRNNMWQINMNTNSISSLPLGVTETQEVVCSADVSENSNKILIVHDGLISTLEAIQEPCSFGQTSQAILCNSTSQCTSCPPPPSNAFLIEGSVSCEWSCMPAYTHSGSRCVAQVIQPCPNYYRVSPDSPGLCVPSVIPWADQGKYATTGGYSKQLSFPVKAPPYLLTCQDTVLIQATIGRFYVSKDSGSSWTNVPVVQFASASCSYSSQNSYYYLSSRHGVMWAAFTVQRVEGTQHCLWAVNTSLATQQLQVIQAWTLNNPLCSAAGAGDGVYAILCGYNYILFAKLQIGSVLSPVVGNPISGHIDGTFLAAKLNGPSSLVARDSRLYIADTGNCVIREVDLIRGMVGTVSGFPSTCQRADGTGSGATLVYPTNLVYTPYDGLFLFVDKYINENIAIIRQFHVDTATVNTIQTMPYNYFTGIVASNIGIIILVQHIYYIYNASWEYCPTGTSSNAGSAFDASDCLACPIFHYSDTLSGTCKPCTSPTCALPGQLFIPCQLSSDAYCGNCTNKPTNNSRYIGASSIPGTPSGGGDCVWVYTPPCPVGYYSVVSIPVDTGQLCSSCPIWSTTAKSGSSFISNCSCMGGGKWINSSTSVSSSTSDTVSVVVNSKTDSEASISCLIMSPFISFPITCSPIEVCEAYKEPAFPFPILLSCTSYDTDTYMGVCPCQPGEYIKQIYPKICATCPAGLYSPSGRGCMVCPYLTEPSNDQSTCRCAAGTYDVALTQAQPSCVCGLGKAFYPSVGCIQCPENTYNAEIREFGSEIGSEMITEIGTPTMPEPIQCPKCPEGMWSPAGASTCTQCPLGQFRQQGDALCSSCPVGSYAPNPAVSRCVDCSVDCSGRKETKCPTNNNLYMCSDCQAPRMNSAFNGQRDCTTVCNTGFYELDGECVLCTEYYKATCPEGNRFVECTPYADAGCVGCVNSSMPLNFALWTYLSNAPNGPNSGCEWECEVGYSPQHARLPSGVEATWECVKVAEWNVWDLFTV